MSSFENNISSTVVERIVRFNSEGVDDISSLLYIERIAFLPDNENHSKEVSVWADFSPTLAGCIVYLFVVPFFCLIGIITNSINIWIFSRPRVRSLGCSAYFYFKAISVLDLILCVLLFFSCFSRTIFYTRLPWLVYDIMVYIPVGNILSNASNVLTCAVSLDRLVYFRNCMPKSPPKMCRLVVARWVVFSVLMASLVLNLPFFFIFEITNGKIHTTEFFHSGRYLIFNSMKLGMLISSIIFLVVINACLICIMHRWTKSRDCNNKLNPETVKNRKKVIKQTQITMTLIMLVMLFVIGEVPMFFSSRTIQTGLVFPEAAAARVQETTHIVATVLNSLHISLNIIIYAWLNPPYMAEFVRVMQSLGLNNKRNQELLPIDDDHSHKVHAAIQHSTLAVWTVLPKSQTKVGGEKEIILDAAHIFTMATTTAATLNGCTAGSGCVPAGGTHYATDLLGLRLKP